MISKAEWLRITVIFVNPLKAPNCILIISENALLLLMVINLYVQTGEKG
jgi:hypothetical protein